MPWMTRSPHKANVCLHQHLKIPAGSTPTATRKTPETTADFLQGLPYRDSPVLCRGSCSYPPRKNKPSAPTARSKAAGRSLAQHAAPGIPSLSQEWLCTAGHHTSWDGNTVAKKKLSIYHNVGFTQSTSKLCVP